MPTVLPGEVKGTHIFKEDNAVEVLVKVDLTLFEREQISEQDIAVRSLQGYLEHAGLFPIENPKLNLPPRNPNSDWSFTAQLVVLPKPKLNFEELVKELQESLHEEDLTSLEDCKRRLIEIVQSKVDCKLPANYLASTESPIQSIEVWRETIARAALADLVNENKPRADRAEKAIELILKNSVETF